MRIIELQQGSEAWHQHRATARNASDVPAMLGISPYKSRADLVRERATGITPEVTPEQQRIFDRGHLIEALARPIAEQIIGEDLYPVVGQSDCGQYSASFDGLTLGEVCAFECKTLNASLRAVLLDSSEGQRIRDIGDDLPEIYRAQMEQQAMVSGCERILFTAASLGDDGQISEARHCWYTPDQAMRARIVAGWEQFDKDVAAWTPEPVTQAPIGRAPETLPALRLEVTGAVTASNLDEFREHALTVIGAINRDLKTDADFADAEKTVKWCADAEARLKAAKDAALAQTESIEQAFRVIDDVTAELRRTRLDLDKLVKAEKDARKLTIVRDAQSALAECINELNHRLAAKQAGVLPSPPMSRLAECVKGLKSLDSMTEKVTAELIRLKAEATETAMRMLSNRDMLRPGDRDWGFLFPDFAAVGTKGAEDFAALAHMRIGQHRQAEAKAKAEREAVSNIVVAEPLPPVVDVPASQRVIVPPKTGERITLGHINALLAPISISAAGLAELGFEPVATNKNAKLYDEGDIPAMCRAIADHVMSVAQPQEA